ncbi:lasso peptide biosynthesis B2 protein [Sphingomonas arenae]|uniref:lasso peptide biosynthesis B2 protein n=1 Tax=Sphingomonas arenae TaxID=2812555 RepID=UPI001967C8C8|nr:lasso peptide biosynthesis B2 protein [Sphingomonas arenae]
MAHPFALASPSRWRRFRRLSVGQRRLLIEAAARLAWAAVLVRVAPFHRVIRSGAVPLGPMMAHDHAAVARAVRWAAAVVPFRTVCLQQGLACQAMLRARGLDARLHYGVATGDGLEGHVWVMLGDATLIGGDEASRFKSVACFPD